MDEQEWFENLSSNLVVLYHPESLIRVPTLFEIVRMSSEIETGEGETRGHCEEDAAHVVGIDDEVRVTIFVFWRHLEVLNSAEEAGDENGEVGG